METINRLERLPSWRSTAVVITWDDSDGWYDHQLAPVVRESQTALDALSGEGQCGDNPARVPRNEAGEPEQGRCGLGPRIPLLVISPWAKESYVDNELLNQASIIEFIEENWLDGRTVGGGSADAESNSLLGAFSFHRPPRPPLFLQPETGEPVGLGADDPQQQAAATPGSPPLSLYFFRQLLDRPPRRCPAHQGRWPICR